MLRKDLVLVSLIVCILALMVIPLGPGLIDVLLALNMTLSVVLLLVAVYLKNPADFSTFPSVILIGTAFRLALSISTTRLILTEAEGGEIISTFGEFVVQGSVAVGLVIFLVITVVQFLVVTKGAERVAEVAARFALDALPGKQMAIDADIRAGTLDAAEGEKRRQRLNRESQVFGSMDGAMKFVKGDAIAGLIIVAINLIGGMIVGVVIHGMTFGEAAALFSLLTVGDGLVAQIPALLMALSAGVIVTRSTGPENMDLGSDIGRELLADPRVPAVASALVLSMGLIPGFPTAIFVAGSAILAGASFIMSRRQRALRAEAAASAASANTAASAETAEQAPASAQPVVNQRFRLSLGSDLARELDIEELWDKLDGQFARLRQRSGVDFATPSVAVQPGLEPWAAAIELDDVPLLSAMLPEQPILFDMPPDSAQGLDVSGLVSLHWPTLEAVAVPRTNAKPLTVEGHVELILGDVLLEQVFRLFERHIGTLFSRREYDLLIATLRREDPDGAGQIVQGTKPQVLFQVFQTLIEDGVPLRPARLLIDSLQFWTQMPEISTPTLLAECLRGSMKRQLCHTLLGPEGMLGLVMLDPEFEGTLRRQSTDGRKQPATAGLDGLVLPNELIEPTLAVFRSVAMAKREPGRQIAVVVGADLRRRLRNFLAQNQIQLPIFAPHEIPPEVKTFPVEVLRLPVIPGGPRLQKAA